MRTISPTPWTEIAFDTMREPTSYPLLTYAWVLGFSIWGGIVNYIRRIKLGKAQPFSLIELVGEISISAFSGMIVFYLCEASNLNQLLTAAIVGMADHMGSRTIFLIEVFIQERILPGAHTRVEHEQTTEGRNG